MRRNTPVPVGRYLILVLVTFLSLLPFLYMASVSFMTLGEALNTRTLLPSGLRWENYAEAWQAAQFSSYFINSVIVTLGTVAGMLILCALAGYAFAQIEFRGRDIAFLLVLATLMVPETVLISPLYQIILGRILPMGVLQALSAAMVVLSLVLLALFVVALINARRRHEWPLVPTSLGLSAALLALLFASGGVRPFDENLFWQEWTRGNWLNTYTVMIVPFFGNAYAIFLFRQFFKQMPRELMQAARLEGAGHLSFFLRIAMPLNLPSFATIGLLGFIWAWNSYMWPRLTQLDGSGYLTLPVGLDAFNRDGGSQTNLIMAGAVISVLPVLLLYVSALRFFVNAAARSGLKG